ncbi:MAG TPA: glycosyl hydrolase [Terriglobia bacterium]
MKRSILLVALLLWGVAFGAPSEKSPPSPGPAEPAETIRIDAQASTTPFPHYWERMFGSGRAVLSLRDSYRQDLRSVKEATGFGYIRFHGIFDDEVGLYTEDSQGRPVYNFSYVDQIYDGLLENGVRPFVELSFMPQQLASKPSLFPFWYHPNNSPPKDWGRWGDLVEAFVRHLVTRYGIDEVSTWYFEVWNEPNIDFWSGEPKEATYDQLYDETARAVKRVSPNLRVGGPSTAQAAWVDRFIKHCADGNIPVDFVSTHVYGNDTSQDVFGTTEAIPRDQMVPRAVKKVHDQVKASAKPGLPIIFSEYNAAYDNEVPVTDSPYMGPWLAYTISRCAGLVDILSYWSFSDVFEEQGVVKRPFYGGFGLIAAGNIPKASFNAFKLLHELGDRRLPVSSERALATERADGALAIAVWNYAPPEEEGSPRQITLSFQGLPRQHHARVRWVDAERGSALTAWRAMDEPSFPSREQQRELREAAEFPPAKTLPMTRGDSSSVTLTLAPHSLALVEVGK